MGRSTQQLLKLGYKNYKELYLDWVNNFLTSQGFADYHNVELKVANDLLEKARWLYKK